MASTSSSRVLWNPYQVLEVNPKDPKHRHCMCVGFGKLKQQRCGWALHKIEQFDPSQRIAAIQCLDSMSEMHPSKIDIATLIALAENTLCSDFHKYQAFDKGYEWKAVIEKHLRENSRGLAAVTPVKQQPYEAVRDVKQPQNGSAKDVDASELEKCKAELTKSEARCSALLAKNSKLDAQREEELAATSRSVDSLRQQLTLEERRVEEAERLRKRVEKEKNDEVERLKRQLAGRNANFERNVAASSKEMKRLEARVKELEALNRKYADERDEDARRIERLREQDRRVELLTKQMGAVSRELGEREGELSSLRPRNAKRSLFAVMSWWPPKIVVRKMGKVVKREDKSYVQSVV